MPRVSTPFGLLGRLPRRFAGWLAMLALVLNALAPALAQAVVSGSGNGDWVQVCNVTGVAWVRLDTSPAVPDSLPAHPVDKLSSMSCTWCGLHGGTPAWLPQSPDWLGQQPVGFALPERSASAETSVLRVGAPARAPPITA